MWLEMADTLDVSSIVDTSYTSDTREVMLSDMSDVPFNRP